jgi:hypothetical protein
MIEGTAIRRKSALQVAMKKKVIGEETRMERLATLAAFLILAGAARKNVTTSEDRKNACTGAEYRQFDFWAGDWDVFDNENRRARTTSRTRLDRILEGCAAFFPI